MSNMVHFVVVSGAVISRGFTAIDVCCYRHFPSFNNGSIGINVTILLLDTHIGHIFQYASVSPLYVFTLRLVCCIEWPSIPAGKSVSAVRAGIAVMSFTCKHHELCQIYRDIYGSSLDRVASLSPHASEQHPGDLQ